MVILREGSFSGDDLTEKMTTEKRVPSGEWENTGLSADRTGLIKFKEEVSNDSLKTLKGNCDDFIDVGDIDRLFYEEKQITRIRAIVTPQCDLASGGVAIALENESRNIKFDTEDTHDKTSDCDFALPLFFKEDELPWVKDNSDQWEPDFDLFSVGFENESRNLPADNKCSCEDRFYLPELYSDEQYTDGEICMKHIKNNSENTKSAKRTKKNTEARTKKKRARNKSTQKTQSNSANVSNGYTTLDQSDYWTPEAISLVNKVDFKCLAETDSASMAANAREDRCCICLEDLANPVVLHKCSHAFCKHCIETQFKLKPVCPVCFTSYGVITGIQPLGKMNHNVMADMHLPGYESYGTIIIQYHFQSGMQGNEHPNPGVPYSGTTRVAYLPDNPEGQKVLRLLKESFRRRLTFTIGRSRTTGADNTVTWNDIHHKTSPHGGMEAFGYPDPTYLSRVQEELSAVGVTEESIANNAKLNINF